MRLTFIVPFLMVVPLSCKANQEAPSDVGDAAPLDLSHSADAGPHACDPLSPSASAFVGAIGVGTDAHGTEYAFDTGSAQIYQFSNGSFYERITAVDETQGYGPNVDYMLGVVVIPGTLTGNSDLLVQVRGGVVTNMAWASGGGKGFDPGTATDTLKLLDPTTVSQIPVLSLPGKPFHVADAADGRTVVVLMTGDPNDVGTFFFGTKAMMVDVGATNRAADDGYFEFDFMQGATSYRYSWNQSVPNSNDGAGTGMHIGAGTLSGGATGPITFTSRDPAPTALPDFSFICQ